MKPGQANDRPIKAIVEAMTKAKANTNTETKTNLTENLAFNLSFCQTGILILLIIGLLKLNLRNSHFCVDCIPLRTRYQIIHNT